jgi:histidinol-phosphate/aromatic aminotransferase/cobyric acid decarboxylase-like protein
LIDDPYPNLALVAKYESWMDGTVITLDEDKNIKSFLDKNHFRFADICNYYKTVNIYKFSKEFSNMYYVPFLEAYCKALGDNEYYEQVLKVIALLDKSEIKAAVLNSEAWYEIDDIQDLDIAETIFTMSVKDKLKKLQGRYGGYWRYPKLLDFCYLVNPFYPCPRLLDEIKASFERLICNYPSGIKVNNLLAAKYFGLDSKHIVVGNGASELIKSLMGKNTSKMGMIVPTFEEYPGRLNLQDIVPYYPDNNNYFYTATELINFYEDKNISALLIINPDNPSGNYIEKDDLLLVADWAEKNDVTLIVDESFVDFADTIEPATLLDEKTLQKYKKLIVIKSISKSFGIPGLRLGILATSNINLIDYVKKDVSIWNINSLAEFFLQIFEKYRNEYEKAMDKFKIVRKDYIRKLSVIENLRVVPTQANYVLCEVLGGNTATCLAEKLLLNYNILIKDLSEKKGFRGQFIRIAVKTMEENDKLVEALNKLLDKD